VIVRVDPRYFRPAEVETLLGNPAKAKAKLGWEPKATFEQMVVEMVRCDLASARRDELVASYAMLRAMGRFTAEDLGLDVDLYDPAANYRDVRDKWFGLEIDDSAQ